MFGYCDWMKPAIAFARSLRKHMTPEEEQEAPARLKPDPAQPEGFGAPTLYTGARGVPDPTGRERSAAWRTSEGSGPWPCRHRSRSRSLSSARFEMKSSVASGEGWSAANASTQFRQCVEQKQPVDAP